MPAIGFLDSRSPEAVVSRLRAFRQGLQESGYVEGENVAIVYRYAENQTMAAAEAAGRTMGLQIQILKADTPLKADIRPHECDLR